MAPLCYVLITIFMGELSPISGVCNLCSKRSFNYFGVLAHDYDVCMWYLQVQRRITHGLPEYSLAELFWRWEYIQENAVFILTHWGRVTHICVGNLAILGSDNGLLPGRRQTIVWNNTGILLIRPSETNFSGILIKIHSFHSRKYFWKYRLENGGHVVSTSMC